MALAIEPGDLKLERSNMLWDPARTFVEMGSTLILVSDGIVRPVHASLTDFLCTDRAPSITAGSGLTVPIKKEKANAYLALTCITYLSFQDFTHAYGSQNQDMIGFLDYAATSWYQHAVLAGKDLHIYEAVVNFLRLPQGFEWMDGLLTYLGKSFVFLLEIQTQLSQWTDSIHPNSSAFTPMNDCYRRKVAEIDRCAIKTPEEEGILGRAYMILGETTALGGSS